MDPIVPTLTLGENRPPRVVDLSRDVHVPYSFFLEQEGIRDLENSDQLQFGRVVPLVPIGTFIFCYVNR